MSFDSRVSHCKFDDFGSLFVSCFSKVDSGLMIFEKKLNRKSLELNIMISQKNCTAMKINVNGFENPMFLLETRQNL